MEPEAKLNSFYKISEDVVAREVAGEFVIIPITSGVGDLEDEVFTLNKTGRAIWSRLDGKRALKNIVIELCEEFEAPSEKIEKDVLGLVEEFLKRKMIAKPS